MEDIIQALLDVVRIQHGEADGTEVEPFNMEDIIDMAMNIVGRPEEEGEEKEKAMEVVVRTFPVCTMPVLAVDEEEKNFTYVYDNTVEPFRIIRKHKEDISIFSNDFWSENDILELM